MSWQSYLNLRKPTEQKIELSDAERAKMKQERKNKYKAVAQVHYPGIKCTLGNSDALLLVSFGIKKINNDQAWIIANLPQRSLDLFNNG